MVVGSICQFTVNLNASRYSLLPEQEVLALLSDRNGSLAGM